MARFLNDNRCGFYTLVLICTFALLIFGCGDEGEKEDWSIDRLTTFGNSPKFSPDGSMVVFGGDDGESEGIWIYTFGSGSEILYEGAFNYDYAWSPGNDEIAFSEPGGTLRKLWIINLDGNITLLIENGRNPSWSPDGSEIVYQDGSGTGVYMISVSGGSPALVSSYGEIPRWAPDGENIAFRTGSGANYLFHIYNIDSGTITQLNTGGANFNWSPDGNSLVFEIYESVSSTGYYFNIRRIEITGYSDELLWQGGTDPKWSPIGGSIAFRSISGFSGSGLLLIPSNGGAGEQITNNGYLPSFGPNGERVVFSRTENGIWLATQN
ncbi:MAG: PD40 domain-containing protein [candidate division Zixibacteria bacterium]|nr:PD40 domain-containing protein [Candidatus Tariuqbacter arcticus]